MGTSGAYLGYLLEQLEELGPVRARAMFGGHGLYLDGRIFAIVVDDTLYLKADPVSRGLFEERGLSRFSYRRRGKTCYMSYYEPPEEALEDGETLRHWARVAYEAALRAGEGG